MLTIAIINAKGGSGKTTISTHLASYYAETKHSTTLIDYDSQGSSTFWANNRPEAQTHIHCIPAYQINSGQTRSFKMRIPPRTDRVIIDTPAAITRHQLEDIVNRSNLIIIPVLPSSIDIHAVNGFIEQLQKLNAIRIGKTKIAVVANKVGSNTDIFSPLIKHLKKINIPFIAKIHDTLNDIHTLNQKNQNTYHILHDKNDWHPLINWIENKNCFPSIKKESSIQSLNNTPYTPPQNTPINPDLIQANIAQLNTLTNSTPTAPQKNTHVLTQNIDASKPYITKLCFTHINTSTIVSSKVDAADLKNKKTTASVIIN